MGGGGSVRCVAARMRRELEGEAERTDAKERLILHMRQHGATVAARRKILNQKVNEAGLLLWFAKRSSALIAKTPPEKGTPLIPYKHRCGKCDDCQAGDCGACVNCLDKPKFGGPGSKKQACSARRCAYIQKLRGEKGATG